MIQKKYKAFFTCFFFSLFSYSPFASAEVRNIYLWDNACVGDKKSPTIFVPQYLVIKGDKFLVAPVLDGGECSSAKNNYFSAKVDGILPPKTPLKRTKAFFRVEDKGWLAGWGYTWLLNFLSIIGPYIPLGRGGIAPTPYCIVEDPEKREFITDVFTASEVSFYKYGSQGEKKAKNILARFTESEKTKKVLLSFELEKEHNEKCGYATWEYMNELKKKYPDKKADYWPKMKRPVKPEKEIKILMERSLKFMEKHRHLYIFEDIQARSDKIEVRLDSKGLAFLILNSSPLRIKNIEDPGKRVGGSGAGGGFPGADGDVDCFLEPPAPSLGYPGLSRTFRCKKPSK